MIYLDGECRSRANIKRLGAPAYCMDPSTEILCMVLAVDDGPLEFFDFTGETHLEQPSDLERAWRNIGISHVLRFHDRMLELLEEGHDIEAHNALMEYSLLRWVLPRHGITVEVPVERFRCSAAKAAAHGLPRALENMAKVLMLEEQKDKEGNKLMKKLCSPYPRKASPFHPYTVEEIRRLMLYCGQDVRTERAGSKELRDLSEEELAVFHADMYINLRGIPVDTKLATGAVHVAERYAEEVHAQVYEITDHRVKRATMRQKLLSWFKDNGAEFENTQRQTVDEALERETDPRGVPLRARVVHVLQAMKRVGRTSASKFKRVLEVARSEVGEFDAGIDWGRPNAIVWRQPGESLPHQTRGRLKSLYPRVYSCFMYHGAHTGRWSGKILQPQNLARCDIKPWEWDLAIGLLRADDVESFFRVFEDPMATLRAVVRAVIQADPGFELVGGDFSQVEARVLFWLAECERGLELFRDASTDPYCYMASRIFNRAVTKADKPRRWVGKQTVLGCGFQMGAERFQEQCASYEDVGIEVTEDLSEDCVAEYRETFSEVPKLWKEVEAAAIEAVHRRGEGSAVACAGGRVLWGMDGRFLRARLPSGRTIAYPYPEVKLYHHVKIKKDGTRIEWTKDTLFYRVVKHGTKFIREPTFGGKLVENLAQAIARDLQARAMVRAERENLPIIAHSHDELMAHVKKGHRWVTGPNSTAEEKFREIFLDLPEWAEGLPIDCETWTAERYEK